MRIPEVLGELLLNGYNPAEPYLIDPIITMVGFPSDLLEYYPRFIGTVRDAAIRWLKEAQEDDDVWTIDDLERTITDYMSGYSACLRDYKPRKK